MIDNERCLLRLEYREELIYYMNKYIFALLSLPNTIWCNYKLFPIKEAIKLPVFVAYNVHWKNVSRNQVEFLSTPNRFQVKIGNGGSEGIPRQKSMIRISDKGKLIFSGTASLGEGICMRIDGGTIIFGDNFRSNKNAFLACNTQMQFGTDVLLGWNVKIRDSDGHFVQENNEIKPNEEPVFIGDHVWICSFVDILKNTFVGKNSVVAYRACVSGKYDENSLIGGCPAKCIKHNINWIE